ncbi:MAG: hypothetical protein ACRDLR_03725 [Gaiellaceae bacterium]
MRRAISKIALNPLRHKGFTFAIMSDASQVGKEGLWNIFRA